MTVLVAGSRQVDAGKTTFSTGLVARIGTTGFKPRAGNDRWFDHDDYRMAVERGRLYGKDAKRLAAASEGRPAPEEVNPVHRLWQPAPGHGSGLLGREDREFLLDRVGDRYVVNGQADLPALVRDNLPVADAGVVDSLREANEVMGQVHLDAVRGLTDAVEAADPGVVESYGDVALPLRTVDYDAVAVVEPRRARVYDGGRYEKAHRVAAGGPREGQLEETVADVVGPLEPAATVELPPLGSDERHDPAAVARAYGDAYDELLAVAGG
jgi:predicted P-loop ATPase/GTPase